MKGLGVKGRFIDVEGGRLWVTEGGPAGALPLIFLHGFSFDVRSWAAQVERFGTRYRTIAYDLRGFGRSRAEGGAPFSHVDDLAALIDTLGIDRPILVGLSLGGNIALSYALAHPGKASGLLLASPGLPGHAWRGERPSDVAATVAQREGIAKAKAYWLGHPLLASLADNEEARSAVHEMVADYDGAHWTHPHMVMPPAPAADRLHELRLPLLVVSGTLDLDEYRLIARKIAEGAPGAHHIEFDGAGHVVNIEAPMAFNEALERLIDETVAIAPITFDLDEPGTFVFSGPVSTRGLRLNRFALSLKRPENRAAFLADEAAYIARSGLSEDETRLVRERDWTGLLRAGGHLQAILKLAATVGQSLWHIGAHNAGVDAATMMSLCPRRVSQLPLGVEKVAG